MKIGNVNIKGYAGLAPMAGVADRAFREICHDFGATYVIGEMVSAKGMTMGDRKSAELLLLSEKERPAAVQLFGDEPDVMARAAEKAMEYSPEIIDINMGCPAPKIASGGGGSALMKTPELAAKIVRECVRASPVPVTVKMRSGWDGDSKNAVELAKMCEANGAAAVTVHGRTKLQMYAPPVDYEIIRAVKQAVKIPVIGNGDVDDGKSARHMLEVTGCDYILVGRGAMGRPWVFSQISEFLLNSAELPEPPVERRMEIMKQHIALICKYKNEKIGMKEARKHAMWYMKGIRGAAAYRREMCALETLEQLYNLAEEIIACQ